jgi:hypothetical protein
LRSETASDSPAFFLLGTGLAVYWDWHKNVLIQAVSLINMKKTLISGGDFRSTCGKVALLVASIALCLELSGPVVPAQSVADSNIRISQIYTRGGEAGAVYQNDFIELFNRGTSTVDITGWSINITGLEGLPGNSSAVISFTSNLGIPILPGRHLLLQFAGSGANGQPLSGDIPVPILNLAASGGQIALLGKGQTIPPGCPAAPDLTGAVVDYVGYGTATCSEGNAPTLAPPVTKALLRIGGGCTDDNNNLGDFSFADPNPRNLNSTATPCGGGSFSIIDFSAPQFDTFEGAGSTQIRVSRIGDLSTPATVDYFVSDGTKVGEASERRDFTTALGTLRFAPGETQKTFDVLITDDAAAEPNETAFMGLLNPTGNAGIGPRNSAQLVIHENGDSLGGPNPLDASGSFVQLHYHDFLNREADGPGLLFWINNIDHCGADAQCRAVARIDTSAAFFFSVEFQRTGFLVYRLYKASLPETVQRPRALPRYREFIRDTGEIGRGVVVNSTGWEQQLEANTVGFLDSFVTRAEFLAKYPVTLTAVEYVERLNAQAGDVLSPSERSALASQMSGGTETRATVLRKIAENSAFSAAEFNRAFVLMQYFGYLRRNPDDAPDLNFAGFDFWLKKLNDFGGNYNQAEMVKAFIDSGEYRNRFVTP